MVYSVRLDRSAAPDPIPTKPLPTFAERAKQIAKPFAGDDALEAWTARMIAEADEYQNRKLSDPLGGFLMTRLR